MKSIKEKINEAIVKHNIKKTNNIIGDLHKYEITKSEFIKLLDNNEYIIYIEEFNYEDDDISLGKSIYYHRIFIMNLGDDTISAEYGLDKYNKDADEVFDQEIDGLWWKNTHGFKATPNNVLEAFKKKTNIDCCREVNIVRENSYKVHFIPTKKFRPIKYRTAKIYDLTII